MALDSYTPFAWPIVLYLFFAGISFGSSLSGLVLSQSKHDDSRKLAKPAWWIASLTIFFGSFWLIADLESPQDALLILSEFNPTSVISWGARIIILYGLVCFYAAVFYEPESGKQLNVFLRGLILALTCAVGIYPALVLGQALARPMWGSSWLIPLFVTAGFHSGSALVQLIAPPHWHRRKMNLLKKVDIAFIIIQIVFLFTLIHTSGLSDEATRRVYQGELALWLWGGVALLGCLVPFLSYLPKTQSPRLMIFRQLCFLGSALALRAVIVLGGQGTESFLGA